MQTKCRQSVCVGQNTMVRMCRSECLWHGLACKKKNKKKIGKGYIVCVWSTFLLDSMYLWTTSILPEISGSFGGTWRRWADLWTDSVTADASLAAAAAHRVSVVRPTDRLIEWHTAAAAAAAASTMGASQTRPPHKYQDLADQTGCKWGKPDQRLETLLLIRPPVIWNHPRRFLRTSVLLLSGLVQHFQLLFNCCVSTRRLFDFNATLAPPRVRSRCQDLLFSLSSFHFFHRNETKWN